jgi:hypothetical protein
MSPFHGLSTAYGINHLPNTVGHCLFQKLDA